MPGVRRFVLFTDVYEFTIQDGVFSSGDENSSLCLSDKEFVLVALFSL